MLRFHRVRSRGGWDEPGADEWLQMLADLDAGQWGWDRDAPIVVHADGRVELGGVGA